MVQGREESGARRRRIRLNDWGQLQPAGDVGQQRRAELPAAAENEVDGFGRRLFGRTDEIALVFAVLRVHDDDHPAASERIDSRLKRRKSRHHVIIDGATKSSPSPQPQLLALVLEREEYIEQAHLFRTLSERLAENVPMQELLAHVKQEILSTNGLP